MKSRIKKDKKFPFNILNELPEDISGPITCLYKEIHYELRTEARNKLVKMGREILPILHNLLEIDDNLLRSEVAKVLKIIGDRETIPVFIKLLKNSDSGIRWVAADGLINVGRESIVPVLKSIIFDKKESFFLRLGAHHVLMELFSPSEKNKYKALLHSFQSYDGIGSSISLEAYNALPMIEKQEQIKKL
jgi:HEAT repeat protein